MSNTQIWLSGKPGDRFQFPVNPETIGIKQEMSHNVVSIHSLGEVTLTGNSKAREVSFSGLLPRDYDRSYCEPVTVFFPPMSAVKKMADWMHSKTVLTLNITSMANISIPVMIHSFDYEERGGEVGDIFYTITLREYAAPVIRKYDPSKTPGSTRPTNPTTGVYYVVKSGDTLSSIAKKFYGKSGDWTRIYNANKAVIGSNPNLIKVGMKLWIPNATGATPPSDGPNAGNVNQTMYVTANSLNMRSGAGTSYKIITVIPYASAVKVTKKLSSGWYFVSYGGKTGYVSSTYLSAKKPTPSAPKKSGPSPKPNPPSSPVHYPTSSQILALGKGPINEKTYFTFLGLSGPVTSSQKLALGMGPITDKVYYDTMNANYLASHPKGLSLNTGWLP